MFYIVKLNIKDKMPLKIDFPNKKFISDTDIVFFTADDLLGACDCDGRDQ